MFDHHVGCFGRALATNANNNQSNIVNVGLKPMLYHVCFMYGCEALLDVTYLVCCLMKIHVHLKRVNRRGGKSLEDQGGNRWGAWRREGQQFWGQRQPESHIMLLDTCLCCGSQHCWMLLCKIWPLWPVVLLIAREGIFFLSVFIQPVFSILTPVSPFYSFSFKRCIQWVKIKIEASPSENSSWEQKQNRGRRCQIVQGRCKVFLISILECDFAWWKIKSKLLQAH